MSGYVWPLVCIACLVAGGFIGYLLGSAIGSPGPHDDD